MIYVQFPNHIRSMMFFDDGSSCSIITHKLPRLLGIKSRKVLQWKEVGSCDFKRHKTMLYEVELTDNWGNIYPISLLGIDVDVEPFPHIPAHSLDRPHGEMGLLIGQDNVTPWGGDGPNLVDNLMS